MQVPINGSDPSPDAGEHNGSGERAHERRSVPERRSRNRVADNQKSGRGAETALSRLQMIERRRAALSPDSDNDLE